MGCGGSSPLARGPRLLVQLLVRYIGLIPARAGTTIAVVLALDEIGAHPRSRGDHVRAGVHYCLRGGSSPLARGPPWIGRASTREFGLIPARAGTTVPNHPLKTNNRAHPRSRGDHCPGRRRFCRREGSSPLARGPPTYMMGGCSVVGLIPARAGTTVGWLSEGCYSGAHPRSRGDHCTIMPPPPRIPGSSPLARGPHAVRDGAEFSGGLIPARAGTTQAGAGRCWYRWAHPRSRGDHRRRV